MLKEIIEDLYARFSFTEILSSFLLGVGLTILIYPYIGPLNENTIVFIILILTVIFIAVFQIYKQKRMTKIDNILKKRRNKK